MWHLLKSQDALRNLTEKVRETSELKNLNLLVNASINIPPQTPMDGCFVIIAKNRSPNTHLGKVRAELLW